MSNRLRLPMLHLLLIAVTGIIIYSNTLHAPFEMDEQYYIIKNPFVQNVAMPPATLKEMKGGEMYKTLYQRYVGYLTFGLNYRIGGLAVEGYHVVNITIHIATALLVYLLAMLLFRTPILARSLLSPRSGDIAFFTALFFVAHPVQTEAVTYIMQRLTSLAACLYLLSFVLYLAWRLRRQSRFEPEGIREGLRPARSSGRTRSIFLYGGALLSALLAMKTKENAVTLPAMIALAEFIFFQGPSKRRFLFLLPFILVGLVVPLTTYVLFKRLNLPLIRFTDARPDVSRTDYLFTELRVIVTYARLLLFPVRQNFWYDYPVYHSLLDLPVLLSFFAEASVAAGGIFFFKRSRRSDPACRLVAFGICWFFMSLSVESSIIPLPAVISEYRLYLPSAGFFLGTVSLLFLVLRRPRLQRAGPALMTLLAAAVLLLGSAAYARNSIYRDRVALWTDVVAKSPKSAAAYKNLGFAYLGAGNADASVRFYRRALSLGRDHAEPHDFFGAELQEKGHYKEAEAEFRAAIALDSGYVQAHYDLASMYSEEKRFEDALAEYREVLRLDPGHIKARNNLAGTLVQMGRYGEALGELKKILAGHPDIEDVHYNYNIVSKLVKRHARGKGK